MLTQKLEVAAKSTVPAYIEDVFSTWLYTGAGLTQTITNGIDLAGKGGLVWLKDRGNTGSHRLVDTVRGNRSTLFSESTSSAVTRGDDVSCDVSSFNSNGFTAGNFMNQAGNNYASWAFRKQPKFFDVVTYTGDGNTSSRNISHNLGSLPGFMIMKATSSTGNWMIAAGDSSGNYNQLSFNSDISYASTPKANLATTTTFNAGFWGGNFDGAANISGVNYVVYLFAHNAGGFGLTGTDNVISCGSYTTNGSGVITSPVNLGYEPQWILSKRVDSTGNWRMLDVMRGDGSADGNLSNQNYLYSNLSDAESGPSYGEPAPTATGFTVTASTASSTYIYIAIRRGPMKVPTDGTKVFDPEAYTGNSTSGRVITTSNRPDLTITKARDSASFWPVWFDRLRGGGQLASNNTTAELAQGSNVAGYVSAYGNLGYTLTSGSASIGSLNGSSTYIGYAFTRAPSFFDEVCYTGDGNLAPPPSDFKVAHNLTVRPELVIIKRRNGASDWNPAVAISSAQWVNGPTTGFGLNRADSADTPYNFSTLSYASSTTFSPAVVAGNTGGGYSGTTNDSGATYVAYLFATCPGVSKVGSYTGTGTTQTINCGFTAGARFVLIKRTDASGDWYVWDSARGIVAGNDPYLLLNSTAAEVTLTDYVDPVSTGFELSSTALATVNVSGGSYIFLAIA